MNPPANKPDGTKSLVVQNDQSDLMLRFHGFKTLGEMFWRAYQPGMERTRGLVPPEVHESIWQPIRRFFEPWPDWVLRIAAEVYHVALPNVPKVTIEEAFRFIHFFALQAKIDGSSKDQMPKMPELS